MQSKDTSKRLPSVFDVYTLTELKGLLVVTDNHCFGCTAGNGSSCQGATAWSCAVYAPCSYACIHACVRAYIWLAAEGATRDPASVPWMYVNIVCVCFKIFLCMKYGISEEHCMCMYMRAYVYICDGFATVVSVLKKKTLKTVSRPSTVLQVAVLKALGAVFVFFPFFFSCMFSGRSITIKEHCVDAYTCMTACVYGCMHVFRLARAVIWSLITGFPQYSALVHTTKAHMPDRHCDTDSPFVCSKT